MPPELPALWAIAWPYLTMAVAIASTLDAALPQPAPGSHWLIPRKLLSFVAVNIGHASNGKQPDFVTWIVRIATPVLQAQGLVPSAPAAEQPQPASVGAATAGAVMLVLLLASGLTACAGDPPASILFETRAAYDAGVLVPIARYHALPACPQSAGTVCKDADIEAQLISADRDAMTALDLAEDVVRHSPGTDPTALIADAKSAIGAAQAILANHNIH